MVSRKGSLVLLVNCFAKMYGNSTSNIVIWIGPFILLWYHIKPQQYNLYLINQIVHLFLYNEDSCVQIHIGLFIIISPIMYRYPNDHVFAMVTLLFWWQHCCFRILLLFWWFHCSFELITTFLFRIFYCCFRIPLLFWWFHCIF